MNCRFCHNLLIQEFVNLENSPPSNSFLSLDQLNQPEIYYPLKLYICNSCYLIQVDEYKRATDIFTAEYPYFSSFSTSWLEHSRLFVKEMIEQYGINKQSKVVEIASNDGYLLQYFKEKGIPVLGIEPATNTSEIARSKGIETISEFFSKNLAISLANKEKADLLIANNVLAHVPDLNDFVKGIKTVLNTKGVATLEFPHAVKMIQDALFDTIYHEHFSYFSFTSVNIIFKYHGLRIFNVKEIPSHGGSLRIYAGHENENSVSDSVFALLTKEEKLGIKTNKFYTDFYQNIERIKLSLLGFLLEQKKMHRKVYAYGAAAKGNTLLNYCGIKSDLIPFVVDISPYKQGKYLPGSHIKVTNEDILRKEKPENILILPWNIQKEIDKQLTYTKEWNAAIWVALPTLKKINE